MRKALLIAAIGILAGLMVVPSVTSAAQPKFGLKVGVNMADLTGSDVASYTEMFGPVKSKTAFCVGGFVNFALSGGMAIQVEALYTQKGANFDMGVDGDTVTVHWNTDYIEIPVLFQYTFETKGNVKPMVFVGPSVGFKMSAEVKASYQGQSESMDIPGFQSTDFGLVFGAGLGIGSRIKIDLRYTMGLTKLIEYEGETGDIKNSVFSLMVGYAF